MRFKVSLQSRVRQLEAIVHLIISTLERIGMRKFNNRFINIERPDAHSYLFLHLFNSYAKIRTVQKVLGESALRPVRVLSCALVSWKNFYRQTPGSV